MRLDRLVADSGALTRSEARKQIKNGCVTVDGTVVRDISMHVDESCTLCIGGEEVHYSEFMYLMLNKPQGYVSATEDKKQKTVLDLLDPSFSRYNLFPVGRLDIDTVGFLLLTNDGALAHRLTAPSKDFGKTYFVRLEKNISDNEISMLEEGVDIGGLITKPAKVIRQDENEILLTITEGKFHQIKRMAKAVNNSVIYLKRLSYGELFLDETLEEGNYRPLSRKELDLIYNVNKNSR